MASSFLRQLKIAQQLEEETKEAKRKADEEAKKAREKEKRVG